MTPRFVRTTTLLLALAAVAPACDRRAEPASSTASSPSPPVQPAPSRAVAPSHTAEPASPPGKAGPIEGEASGVRYLEIVTGGALPDSELPMVMAIHGLGDRPDSFAGVLADLDAPARLIVPRGLTQFHDGFSWFPLRGGLDDAETSRGIVAAAEKLAAALTELAKKRPTRGRPFVTGFSQGGALSFAIAVLHPDAVAAAYPVGGWVSFPIPSDIGRRGGAPPPIIALHGAADSRVPIGPTRDAVAKLRSQGLPVELREFPGVAHSIPEPVRRELHGLIAAAVSRR